MFDIIPPANRWGHKPAPLKKRRRLSPAIGPQVIKIQWKPPARLSRPIRAELRRAREQRRQNNTVLGFTRRPIISKVPTEVPGRVEDTEERVASGVEWHTGDVYLQSRPAKQIEVPPHLGAFTAAKLGAQPRSKIASVVRRKAPRGVSSTVVEDTKEVSDEVPEHITALIEEPGQARLELIETARRELVMPRRRFALPLHLSVWPFATRRDRTAEPQRNPAVRAEPQLSRSETPSQRGANPAVRAEVRAEPQLSKRNTVSTGLNRSANPVSTGRNPAVRAEPQRNTPGSAKPQRNPAVRAEPVAAPANLARFSIGAGKKKLDRREPLI